MDSGARFSRDRRYRYALWRTWDENAPQVMFIGLNPSTADEQRNDPTVRRCIGYARDWGYGGMWMMNLFAYRATEPARLKSVSDPVGPRNDEWIRRVARHCQTVVAVWGNHGRYMGRSAKVSRMLEGRLSVLRMNDSGEPAHPLYLPKGLRPVEWPRQA